VNAASVGLAREIIHTVGAASSPTRVVDPAFPLLSQSLATSQTQWLPGLRTFEHESVLGGVDDDQDRSAT